MKKAKCIVTTVLAILVAIGMMACGGKTEAKPAAAAAPAAAAPEPTVIKLGTTVNERDSFQIAAEKFAELVKDRTKGAYKIEIFPNSALGDERTMLESMQMGTLDSGIITSGPFVNFVADFGVLDMPFMFSNNEEAYKILDGEIGQGILKKLETANLKGLAYAERGFRNLTNSVREVKTAADSKGLKIRVMENPVYISTFKALGVNAVPMAWTEALTALQQNTINGQENPVNVIHAFKLWESQKYVTMTRHAYASAIITMGLKKFNSFPADVQKAFIDSAQDAAVFERKWVADNETKQMAELEANGMKIVRDPDLNSFRKAVASVYSEYAPKYGEYLKQINTALGR